MRSCIDFDAVTEPMLQYLNLSQQGDLHTIDGHGLRSVLSDIAGQEAA
jgi:hypothetical protein